METFIKKFSELTIDELYAILALRSRVFVEEQDCVYNDLDFKDQEALHVFVMEDGKCISCARALQMDSERVQIGRVVTTPEHRGEHLSKKVFQATMHQACKNFDFKYFYITSQVQAKGFYKKIGFKEQGEAFMMEGLMHIVMTLQKEDFISCIPAEKMENNSSSTYMA